MLKKQREMEKEIPTPSSILAWEIPRTEEAGGWQLMGSQESDTTEAGESPPPSSRLIPFA